MDDSFADYFATQPPPVDLDRQRAQLDDFLALHKAQGRPVVIITSGGTTVPLEHNMVRFLDNFSAGTRGSASAEYFLEAGYAVVFMHRNFSLEPYSRHYSHTVHCILDYLKIEHHSDGDTIAVMPAHREGLKEVLEKHNKAKAERRLHKIPFVTVTEYLFLLRMASQAFSVLGPSAMFYLAAAVSDFFIPVQDMAVHKIQSAGGPLELRLQQVPKMLTPLCKEWAPSAYIVSFKLETDSELIVPKARASLDKYGHKLVIGNLLTTRKHTVKFVTATEVQDITLSEEERHHASGVEIEQHIVDRLKALHQAFIGQ
eukprot:comp22585_c1_seq1/m.34576 comp22585_c1_seq1/g.34576  ORF comp22585_c1_seq1/g.34576 comp22585_c1_seq1/m.34576 type:complete len:314 (-) comp22585_c1_seq1:31-972(-)